MFAVCCMIADEGNTSSHAPGTQWTETPVPETNVTYPLVRDAVAFSFFVACYGYVEYITHYPGVLLLIITLAVTVSFTSYVAQILEKVSGTEDDSLRKCRMWSTMVFALRYSYTLWSCQGDHHSTSSQACKHEKSEP